MSADATVEIVRGVKHIVIALIVCGSVAGGYVGSKWVAQPAAPGPAPVVVPDLHKRVAAAVDGEDALKFAALYSVASDLLEKRSATSVRDDIGEAKDVLGLDDPELREIVREVLKPYGGSNPDVAAFKADLSRLVAALLEAAS